MARVDAINELIRGRRATLRVLSGAHLRGQIDDLVEPLRLCQTAGALVDTYEEAYTCPALLNQRHQDHGLCANYADA